MFQRAVRASCAGVLLTHDTVIKARSKQSIFNTQFNCPLGISVPQSSMLTAAPWGACSSPSYCLSSIRHARRKVKTPPSKKQHQLFSDMWEADFSPLIKSVCSVFWEKKNKNKNPNVLSVESRETGKFRNTIWAGHFWGVCLGSEVQSCKLTWLQSHRWHEWVGLWWSTEHLPHLRGRLLLTFS